MCGIVAGISQENIVPFLIKGLKSLEYRGYDSAGLGVMSTALVCIKSHGRVGALEEEIFKKNLSGNMGIAHTRWATHGPPSKVNAHPQISGGKVAVVHNGIIENHEHLRGELTKNGFEFHSDTDTEVIAHLISKLLHDDPKSLVRAVQKAVKMLRGSFAIGVLAENSNTREELVIARKGSPLLLGVCENALYCASDASAIVDKTNQVIYLHNGDVARLTKGGYTIYNDIDKEVKRDIQISQISLQSVSLGKNQHYMQKEIFEQPHAIANTLEMVVSGERISPNLFGSEAEKTFKLIKSVTILGCGTSYHAGLTARYWIEDLVGIPCNVEISSEYRYRNSPQTENNLVIVTSQSGETADTIAALQHAIDSAGRNQSLAICNVPESSLVRMAKLKFLTRAGPEIGVASTKAFTTQLVSFLVLAITIAKSKNLLSDHHEIELINLLGRIPNLLSETFLLENMIKEWAELFAAKNNCIFLGRGIHYPIALEGALKLKEISYIHAEGYPAGELKHGPLALIDRNTPVIVVAPNDGLLEKLKSNMKEVSARGGQLYIFADAKSSISTEPGINVIAMPDNASYISPILHTIPLQLLAYHTALIKGTDIDKPRNLAKSVTVE